MTMVRKVVPLLVAVLVLAAPLGLAFADVGDEKPKVFMGVKIGKEEGATEIVIVEVVADSPAEKAGLKMGDIIVKFDKKEYQEPNDFVKAVFAKKPGDKVVIVVKRDGKEMEITVTLAEPKP